MEHPSSLIDDAEFRLPSEFLTDDDFLVENENKLFDGDEYNLFSYEPSHGVGNRENYLTGVTRKMVRASLEDVFSGGFCGNYEAGMAWGSNRSSLCGAGDGYGRRNQSCQTRVSSQAEACDMYCAAVEKLATMNISDGYNRGRGIVDLPRKHTIAAAVKNPNDGAGYYSRQSLQYQKLQALQFQQQQLIQQSRGLKANNNNKIAGHVDLSPSAWCNQPQRRDGSGMRAVFLGDRTGKPRSTGTGVFLPRLVNHTSHATEKPSIATVLIPARVAEVLNLDESVVQPSVRSSASSLNEPSWRQKSYNGRFSSQMKMEQAVNEPRLPSEWAY